MPASLSPASVCRRLAPNTASAFGVRTRMEPDVKTFSSLNWLAGERVSESETIELTFWLKHDADDIAKFDALLLERATPHSGTYGQWLSKEEVVAQLAPSREAISVVMDFVVNQLDAHDVHLNKDKSVIKVKVAARQAEAALETTLKHHSHRLYTKVDIVRCVEPYSLPAHVARHVLVVGELIRFPRMRFAGARNKNLVPTNLTANATASEWTQCGALYSTYTNPYVLASRYGFEFPKTSAVPGNTIAVGEFQLEYYDDDDLKAFTQACNFNQTITISKTVGGNSASSCEYGVEPCIESLLDMEYAGAIAGAIPLQVFYATDYALLTFASMLSEEDDPPLVVSVSYGNDEVQQTGSSFMEAVSTAFMKLGAQGTTILFAAGDQGTWGRSGFGTSFHPDFPAGSPYVTAVGGTDFVTQSSIGEEMAWTDGGSGFSDEFATASWQTEEVSNYLSSDADLPKSSLYNADGRGYPDVSALAGEVNPYFISYKDGTYAAVSGTSAACPVVAAMIAQINDKRLAAGKSSLGFLNPALYAAGEAGGTFNDVTKGSTSGGFMAGFPAAEGWDAAVGYGTPIFEELAAQLVAY